MSSSRHEVSTGGVPIIAKPGEYYLQTESRTPPVAPWEAAISKFGVAITAVASGASSIETIRSADGDVEYLATNVNPTVFETPESTYQADIVFNKTQQVHDRLAQISILESHKLALRSLHLAGSSSHAA